MSSPWVGGEVTARAACVLAPNAGPMTLDGTNTWVLREPGASESVVVDPGPLHEAHLQAVLERAGPISVVLLTHGHADHSAGAVRLAQLAGCGVRALDPAHRLGGEGLGAGDRVLAGGLELEVVATPGHTRDSLSFLLPAEHAVLTGDTVLGRGTSVVAHPDGELGAYLGSLHRLRALAEETGLTRVLPGHGPVLEDAVGVLDGYLRHRADRLAQVRDAVADGARTPAEVVARVYADVDRVLWPAAELSVAAQLAYLSQQG
ncbi:MAG: MBL-fold metallo-hydrolase superfamily [uncultured Nocardioidaceae bacterium]|uniref:MBL-fold metallo-hydrolase superfamily n=1 Tax=uncultured Nocardioidaceae bacterium TaxID=253824 RepID=A0A6J4MNR6_9ACTN|nr:MAG: MBL-fold metallo-hydrolase superfamily [uncultured Nocardioidaceae bacterium]